MPSRLQITVLTLFVPLLLAADASAQSEISVQPPRGGWGWLTRPYQARRVPEIRLTNSPRLNDLIRAGNLYLTAPDVVALAIENNIDVEVQRYGPLLAQEVLRRAEGGGALRSVGLGVAAGPQSVSLQGVSVNNSGSVALSGGNGVSSGGGIVTQLGPSIPSLDPSLFALASLPARQHPAEQHLPDRHRRFDPKHAQLPSAVRAELGLRIDGAGDLRQQPLSRQQQFLHLNPYTSGDLDLQVTQNLLQGFGSAVNGRNIRVQRNNVKVSDLQFKQQVITTVSAALNLYWDLVSFNEDVRARQQEVATAQQLLDDNKRQVQIGALAEIEITRAEAQLYSSQQDLVVSQTNLQQQEIVLKNALCRNGISAAGLENIHVVPLDKIQIPASDDIRPVPELVNEALANRTEIVDGAAQYRKQRDESGGHQELAEAHAAGLRRTDQQRPYGRADGAGRRRSGRRVSGGRLRKFAGADRAPQLSQLFGGIFAEHSAAQSRGAIRLRHQRTGAPPEPAQSAQEHQPGDRGRAECRDRPAAGPRALRRCVQSRASFRNRRWRPTSAATRWAPPRFFR